MPVLKKMEIAVINITTHPHSPEGYIKLLQDVFDLKSPVGYRGVEKFILNKPMPIVREDPTQGIYGYFHRYVDIDVHGPWMNLERLETIESEDGEPVINIPEEMKPHCKTAPFVFLPKGHRLFFPTKNGKITFSSSFIAKSLIRVFSQQSILDEYGEVDINIESKKETVTQILSIPDLTKLTINISLPNSDDLHGLIGQSLERMKRQHARKCKLSWTGNKEEGIEPDEDTQGFMGLATSNGSIYAEGWSGTEKIKESTSHHPVTFKESYSHEESPLRKLIHVAQNTIQNFTGQSQ